MGAAADMLKPTEAAVIARVTLRDVNRVVDERVLPKDFLTIDLAPFVKRTQNAWTAWPLPAT
jgi:hypothetical protein